MSRLALARCVVLLSYCSCSVREKRRFLHHAHTYDIRMRYPMSQRVPRPRGSLKRINTTTSTVPFDCAQKLSGRAAAGGPGPGSTRARIAYIVAYCMYAHRHVCMYIFICISKGFLVPQSYYILYIYICINIRDEIIIISSSTLCYISASASAFETFDTAAAAVAPFYPVALYFFVHVSAT